MRKYKTPARSVEAVQRRIEKAAVEWGHPLACPISLLHVFDYQQEPGYRLSDLLATVRKQEEEHARPMAPCICMRLPDSVKLRCSIAAEKAKKVFSENCEPETGNREPEAEDLES